MNDKKPMIKSSSKMEIYICIVMDLINTLLGNSPVNTCQHTSRNNGGSCVFYVVMSPTIEPVSSMASVQSAYKGSKFTS
jgi:hypothetical protein